MAKAKGRVLSVVVPVCIETLQYQYCRRTDKLKACKSTPLFFLLFRFQLVISQAFAAIIISTILPQHYSGIPCQRFTHSCLRLLLSPQVYTGQAKQGVGVCCHFSSKAENATIPGNTLFIIIPLYFFCFRPLSL